MLDVRGLRKVYASRDRQVEAVRDVSFSVAPGELVCLVGPSGCGKTTLLKCLAGLLGPSGGEVVVEGRPVDGPPPGMAVVFQEYGRSLFPWMTVAENVELPLRQKKLPRARRKELVTEALAAVGLLDVPAAYPWQLSGGMQQRVAIARAVAYEPHVMLMDEPFAAVDAQTRADLEDLIRTIWGRTGVPVTTARGSGFPSHPTALAAANRPSSRLAAPGTASTLTSTSGTRWTSAPTEPARLA